MPGIFLLELSWLYGCAVGVRNWCFNVGLLKVTRVSVPVISVGNMTAGGTGKTQFVEYILRRLLGGNKKVAVLSRGYKRRTVGTVVVSDGVSLKVAPAESGDEPYQIARKFPAAVVIVDEKRVRAAKLAVKTFAADVIVLDDGFQHRSLARDLDIVMINGAEPLGHVPMLPAGLRREPLRSLRRASAIVVSGPERPVPQVYVQSLRKPVMKTVTIPVRICSTLCGKTMEPAALKGRSCVAFCGVGDPGSFRRTLEELDAAVRDFIAFPDHHWYSTEDLDRIARSSEENRSEFIITTEKDAVRMSPHGRIPPESMDLYYVDVQTVIVSGEQRFHMMLDHIVNHFFINH